MQLATVLAQGISIVAFGSYGTLTLLSGDMIAEFERYGLARLRVVTATLQIAASIGLALGYVFRPALVVSAAGLSVMMFMAVLVRIRIRDPIPAMIPALALMGLNIFLVIRATASPMR